MDVPLSLRRWFIAHSVVDLIVGLPLLLAPALVLHPLGWGTIDQVAVRLVGAALLAIGLQSFLGRSAGVEVYKAMLNVKLVWSGSAIVGLVAAIGAGAPQAAWAFLSAFLAFFGVWTHYRIRFKQLAAAQALSEELEE
jgi:hypothetical protein